MTVMTPVEVEVEARPVDPVTEILIKTREILLDQHNWCAGWGLQVMSSRSPSTRHCVLGWAAVVMGMGHDPSWRHLSSDDWMRVQRRLENVAYKRFHLNMAGVNDGLGYTSAMLVLDDAIAEAIRE